MSQVENDPERIGWIVGSLLAGGASLAAVLKGTKARIFTGSKVDDLSLKIDDRFASLEKKLNAYFIEDAKYKADLSARIQEHERRLERLER